MRRLTLYHAPTALRERVPAQPLLQDVPPAGHQPQLGPFGRRHRFADRCGDLRLPLLAALADIVTNAEMPKADLDSDIEGFASSPRANHLRAAARETMSRGASLRFQQPLRVGTDRRDPTAAEVPQSKMNFQQPLPILLQAFQPYSPDLNEDYCFVRLSRSSTELRAWADTSRTRAAPCAVLQARQRREGDGALGPRLGTRRVRLFLVHPAQPTEGSPRS